MKAKFLVPLALFLLLAGFLAFGLNLNPREVPSPLIDKPAPAFSLPQLQVPDTQLSLDDMKGQVWLLNVWASWCVACRQEHPVLVDFASSHVVPIIGLNYKDQSPDALRWLDEFGNPYVTSIVDADGRVGIDFGVYGVPETFLIDKQGVIRFKQIGPVTPDALQNVILPKIRELQGAA
ncbi:MAG: DsbE family thiol:disulfide interchange protein [Rhodocyclaceae bacterium]|uniref:DsbE family thiol:disulfide interchange protein n=1 Tax=Cognatazoarcus halotolerans TaxID=2686016 RepID=UPI0013582AAE|nr:DsbE family thiol:disulfide interchange protein [Cognatazoarcus halotolerans]MBX3687587.1 DsbE family thiol:disulfide interchange protein [Rhodocyclaceae bacterium]MCB1910460.1 DsbE family thiol:disulfide interchange protein [Rhodocyclaceae bacterium]MCP5239164.1 DsbE family thiol:disulfide interchange protein [Zoogloeaceae bacterium]MCW5615812.1 DsbE family thiol:disulfide interchange protein [Rhodocyclaceae bacterium]